MLFHASPSQNMNHYFRSLSLTALISGLLLQSPARAEERLFKSDFNSPSEDADVQKGSARTDKDGQPLDGGNVERALVSRKGQWQTPPVAVKAFEYYRIRCRTRVAESCYISATFYDRNDKPLVADVYDRVDPSDDWQPFELCVRGRLQSSQMRVQFHASSRPLSVDDIHIERVTLSDVAKWADTLASQNPVMRYRPPADRGSLLPKTMTRLQEGGRLRIVILGDSICNDTSNSNFETLLQRDYPKSQIEVITSVRSSTGCQYYKQQGRVEEFVLRYKPDLVLIGGISHGFDVESIRDVIHQIRSSSDCEIMVMSGAVTPHETIERFAYRRHRGPRDELLRQMEAFPNKLRHMARDEKVEYLDIRSAWDDFILRSYRPSDWFMRDIIHANSRGKQVLGRILLRHFEP